MNKKFAHLIIIFAALAATVYADEIADTGRALARQWGNAVVQVKLVIEMNEYESKAEAVATFINADGVAVMSLSNVDPGSAQNWSDAAGSGSKIKDLKMILTDGSEIDGEVVLRDPDLDLALVRPVGKPPSDIAFVDLKDPVQPEMLEPILVLARMGENIGREMMATAGRIQAVIKKPRLAYVTDMNAMMGGLAVPVFALSGKVVGIMLMRVAKSETGMSGDAFGGFSSMGMFPVIVPAEEILAAVKKIPK